MRATQNATYFLVPLDVLVPEPSLNTRILGLDWGVRRLLTGAVIESEGSTATTNGRPFFLNSRSLQNKNYRRRNNAEILAAKVGQMDRL